MTPRRRWLILASLLTATLAAVVWVSEREAEQGVVASVVKPRATAKSNNEPRQIALDKLQRAPAVEDEAVSDLFSSKSWYVPPPPPKPLPPPPPAPPPMPFVYLGKLVEDGKTTVFLAKQNRNYSIQEGDTVDGTYRADSVDATRIVFTYIPLDMQQTLNFGGAN